MDRAIHSHISLALHPLDVHMGILAWQYCHPTGPRSQRDVLPAQQVAMPDALR